MRTLTLSVPVGSPLEIGAVGDYVRIKSASVPVRVQVADANVDATVEEGDSLNLKRFNSLRFSHDDVAVQTVVVMVGNGTSSDSAKVGGAVSVTGLPAEQGAYVQALKTVTIASAELLPANAARRSLLIQNLHATGNIWVTFDGTAAVVGQAWKIDAAGGALVLDRYPPTGQLRAIGDVASNASVVVVEG